MPLHLVPAHERLHRRQMLQVTLKLLLRLLRWRRRRQMKAARRISHLGGGRPLSSLPRTRQSPFFKQQLPWIQHRPEAEQFRRQRVVKYHQRHPRAEGEGGS